MFRRLCLAACVLSISAAALGASFPNVVPTTNTLYTAVNECSSILSGGIGVGDLSLTVADGACFPDQGFVFIGNEAIKYTTKNGSTFSGLTRGADGTTAAAHSDGATVDHSIVAAHHNVLKDELIAISTFFLEGSTVHIDTTNARVGIGTTAPGYPMQVRLTAPINGLSYGQEIFQDRSSGAGGLQIRSGNGTGNDMLLRLYAGGPASAPYAHKAYIATYDEQGAAAGPLNLNGMLELDPTLGGTISSNYPIIQTGTITIGAGGLIFVDPVDGITFGDLTTLTSANIPAANIAAGSLGASVMASSVAVNSVGLQQMSFTPALLNSTQTWTAPQALMSATTFYGVVYATATVGAGESLSVAGAGARMFWYPKKAAFRAGGVNSTTWDDANIGNYSVAIGQNNKAAGVAAVALGNGTAVTDNSISIGNGAQSSGAQGISMGYGSLASGDSSIAIGYSPIASGVGALALGRYVKASNDFSYAIGTGYNSTRYDNNIANRVGFVSMSNVPSILITGGNATTPGNVGIGTTAPSSMLEVNGTVTIKAIVEKDFEAGALIPAKTTGCATATTYETTNYIELDYVGLSSSTTQYFYMNGSFPDSWDATSATSTFSYVWFATGPAVVGTSVTFCLQGRAIGDNDVLDQATWGTAVCSSDWVQTSTAVHLSPMSASLTIGGTLAAGKQIQWRGYRSVDDAADTMAVQANLVRVKLYWRKKTLNDQ